MNKYKKLFLIHHNKRFIEYLEEVKNQRVKSAAKTLLTHKIIASLNTLGSKFGDVELKRAIGSIREREV